MWRRPCHATPCLRLPPGAFLSCSDVQSSAVLIDSCCLFTRPPPCSTVEAPPQQTTDMLAPKVGAGVGSLCGRSCAALREVVRFKPPLSTGEH